MTKQIPLEEALELVSFTQDEDGEWQVKDVYGYVHGDTYRGVFGNVGGDVGGSVSGDVRGKVWGSVCGNVVRDVGGSIGGNVGGTVKGDIKLGEWQRMKTPRPTREQLITDQIPIEEALSLVSFTQDEDSEWQVEDVYGDVQGDVDGSVCGDVGETVRGDIKSDEWQRVETPRQKLKRLVEEGADKQTLHEAVFQLEDTDD